VNRFCPRVSVSGPPLLVANLWQQRNILLVSVCHHSPSYYHSQ